MYRRTDEQIKATIKSQYKAMHQSGCNTRVISKAISPRYNPRLVIEAIQEYNDERIMS
jgi:hypothetical protein